MAHPTQKQHADWKVHFTNEEEEKNGGISKHWQAFIIPYQILGSNKESDEKSVILRHFPKTGGRRCSFEANGVESSVIIISSKGLWSTWWMLISPIPTRPSLHRRPERSSLRFCTTAGAKTTRRLKCQHIAHVKTGDCFTVDGLYLNCNIQLIKWNAAVSQEPWLHSTFPPLRRLLIVFPCQHHYLLTHALPSLCNILKSIEKVNNQGGSGEESLIKYGLA